MEQLDHDGQPDLGWNDSINVTDLMHPLASRAFPSSNYWELGFILGYIVNVYTCGVTRQIEYYDPYKVIYVTSLYLHCFVRGKGPEGGAYVASLAMLSYVSMQLDVETRFQVCRFLASLVPTICAEATRVSSLLNEPAPMSSILATMSAIAGSVVSDLSLIAEKTMKSEKIGETWAEVEVGAYEGTSTCWGVGILRNCLSQMYDISGKMRQVADRFLPAIGDDKEDSRLP